jgi:hypothetical protein
MHNGEQRRLPDAPNRPSCRLDRVATRPHARAPRHPAFTQAPAWVCEVISPSTGRIDRSRKMRIYAREGVGHLWFVEPQLQTLEVYRLEWGRWVVIATHAGDDTVRAEPFDAVDLRLERWWIPHDTVAEPWQGGRGRRASRRSRQAGDARPAATARAVDTYDNVFAGPLESLTGPRIFAYSSPAMDLVPDDDLVPPDAHARGFDHYDAALVLDGWLRRLAAQDARCRLVLGRLAAVFLRTRTATRLGFARVGDYARERLGLSGRELQSLAHVVVRLADLPMLHAAFRDGRLSWAQVRLLVGVATADTELEWLATALGGTTRELEAAIRQTGRPPDDGAEEEPALRVRIPCSRRVRRLWADAVQLARRVAGAELTAAHAAEAIAAEGLSAVPAAIAIPPASAPAAEHVAPLGHLDWTAARETLPADVEALADDLDACDAFALDARLRAVVCARQRIDWQMGRLLRVFVDRRLFRALGFPSAARYLRERLGVSARKARALVALERKTWRAPGLADAYRSGVLSWVRAQALLPVVGERTVDAWLARAREVTVRRLEDEVEWAVIVSATEPPPPGASLDIPDRQMRARPAWELEDTEIAFSAPASVVALFRSAVQAFRPPGDPVSSGFERLLHHVRATWEDLPRHRDPVFARDGWRCTVPACTARRNLHDHHLLFRSRGGGNARENRITICGAHHLHGIHAGRVRAWGDAPHAVTWELGVSPGREPLMRLVGDAYVEEEAAAGRRVAAA